MKKLSFPNFFRGYVPYEVSKNIATETYGFPGTFDVRHMRAMRALLAGPLQHAELSKVIFGGSVKNLMAELRGLGLDVPCRWTGERGRMTRRYGFNMYDREKVRVWLFIESKKLIGSASKNEQGVIDEDKDPVIFAEVQAHVMALGGTLKKVCIRGSEMFQLSYRGLKFASLHIKTILLVMGGLEGLWC